MLKDRKKMQKYSKELGVDGKPFRFIQNNRRISFVTLTNLTDYEKLAEILLQRPLDFKGATLSTTRLTEEELKFMQEMAKKRFDTVLTTLKQMPRNMLFVVRYVNIILMLSSQLGIYSKISFQQFEYHSSDRKKSRGSLGSSKANGSICPKMYDQFKDIEILPTLQTDGETCPFRI